MVKRYTGTNGNDYKEATRTLGIYWEAWEMKGFGGNDTLIGGGSNDTLWGGLGIDRLEGRGGNDTYMVQDARTVIIEGHNQGHDRVYTSVNYALSPNIEDLYLYIEQPNGVKIETAISGIGNDLNNKIVGNKLDNRLIGNAGNDLLQGEGGHDVLIGGTGSDTLDGGAGNDFLYSFSEGLLGTGDAPPANMYNYDDDLYGGAGNDYLVAGHGRDTLWGDHDFIPGTWPWNRPNSPWAGNDTLVSGTDDLADYLFGGRGDDTYIIRAEGAGIAIEFENEGTDTIRLEYNGRQFDVPNHIERVQVIGDVKNVIGHRGDNHLIGNNLANILTGNGGNDHLVGNGGNDTLYGGNGNDYLAGGDDDDLLYGGGGSDRIYGEAGNDKLDGWGQTNNEIDILWGGTGADTFVIGDSTPRGAFYVGYGNSHAMIFDFSRAEGDKIQIGRNDLDRYTFSTGTSTIDSSKTDTFIFYNNAGNPDLVAIVHNNSMVTRADFLLV
jgi:trimeric autotransporter adhesin